MNRQGMELSINFLVLFIIAVVIFAFGVKFLYGIFRGATDIQQVVDQQTQDRIRTLMLDQNVNTVIYPGQITLNRDESAIAGVGIYNNLAVAKTQFYIEAECSKYGDDRRTLSENATACAKLNQSLFYDHNMMVDKGKTDVASILIQSGDASPGLYVIDVKVCKPGGRGTPPTSCTAANYGSPLKLYVEIK